MLCSCSSSAPTGRGAENAPLQTDGLDPNSARPTLAAASQPVSRRPCYGAQDTGAQLLGPSVAPLPPWGRPGKADPVSPSCGPPISSQGLSGDPAGRPPMVLSPLAGSLLLTSGSPPAPRRHQGALPTEF